MFELSGSGISSLISFIYFSDHSQVLSTPPKPKAYWTSEKGKNMRLMLENFAKSNNFDPLVPDNWYSMTIQDFSRMKVKIPPFFFSFFLVSIYFILVFFPGRGVKERERERERMNARK